MTPAGEGLEGTGLVHGVPVLHEADLALRATAREELLVDVGSHPVLELIPAATQAPDDVFHDLPAITFVRESRLPPAHAGAVFGQAVYPAADLVVPDHLVPDVIAGAHANPEASVVLAQLLRATEGLSVPDALRLESMAYSLLQTGVEFARWLEGRPRRPIRPDSEPTVVLGETSDGGTRLTLNRRGSFNAVNTQMRTELVGILSALSLTEGRLELTGSGPHFCSGGDLKEFGLARYPLGAHLERMSQNVPGAVARVAGRMTARVHGACVGAGMEISSFAARVVAAPGTTWRLPEVSMGLLPGCGGTVSIPRRIGRQRTLLLAVTGMVINADTALEWGLVDMVSE